MKFSRGNLEFHPSSPYPPGRAWSALCPTNGRFPRRQRPPASRIPACPARRGRRPGPAGPQAHQGRRRLHRLLSDPRSGRSRSQPQPNPQGRREAARDRQVSCRLRRQGHSQGAWADGHGHPAASIVAVYRYTDQTGALVSEKLRHENPSGSANATRTARAVSFHQCPEHAPCVLYRLPELSQAIAQGATFSSSRARRTATGSRPAA